MLDEKQCAVFKKIKDIIAGNIKSTNEHCDAFNKLEIYVDYVEKWMKTHNIISGKYSRYDIWENIYDSVFCASLLNSENEILDAGAGGGFPGIPLAIIYAQKKFQLVDLNRKKCSFLRSVKAKINLANVTVTNKNLEDVEPAKIIITKAAFAPHNAGILARSVKNGGRIIIWATTNKSSEFENELKKFAVFLSASLDYTLPSGKKRCLLLFTKS